MLLYFDDRTHKLKISLKAVFTAQIRWHFNPLHHFEYIYLTYAHKYSLAFSFSLCLWSIFFHFWAFVFVLALFCSLKREHDLLRLSYTWYQSILDLFHKMLEHDEYFGYSIQSFFARHALSYDLPFIDINIWMGEKCWNFVCFFFSFRLLSVSLLSALQLKIMEQWAPCIRINA